MGVDVGEFLAGEEDEAGVGGEVVGEDYVGQSGRYWSGGGDVGILTSLAVMGHLWLGFVVEEEVDVVENQDGVEFAAALKGVEDCVVEFGEVSFDLSGVDAV